MQVHISDHGGLFSDILDLAFANDLDAAPMPRIDGRFRARKGIRLFLREFCAEKLSAPREKLRRDSLARDVD